MYRSPACVHRTQKNTKKSPSKKPKKIISVINRQLKAPKTSNYYIPVVVINEMCSNEHEQKQVHNKNFFVFFFYYPRLPILFCLGWTVNILSPNWIDPEQRRKRKLTSSENNGHCYLLLNYVVYNKNKELCTPKNLSNFVGREGWKNWLYFSILCCYHFFFKLKLFLNVLFFVSLYMQQLSIMLKSSMDAVLIVLCSWRNNFFSTRKHLKSLFLNVILYIAILNEMRSNNAIIWINFI